MNRVPMIIIGLVLAISAIGGGVWYSASKSSGTSNANGPKINAPTPKPAATIPPDAPAGAEPPEQAGSPTAAVTLEEFADLQCGSCAAAHPTMNEIKSMYGTRIHFIFRNFPLKIPAHDKSYDAAVAAEAAGMQGKFWDMQSMLFTNQKTWTADPTFRQIWKGYAQKIGLDIPKWETDMAGIAAKGRVDADITRGTAVGINSTPTLFINGVSVPFSDMNVEALKARIDAELQKATGQNPAANTTVGAAPAGADNSTK